MQGSIVSCSGEFTSAHGGVKPPLRQTKTLPEEVQQFVGISRS
jgi:hypothetical protein